MMDGCVMNKMQMMIISLETLFNAYLRLEHKAIMKEEV
jgi:hypothetical protein